MYVAAEFLGFPIQAVVDAFNAVNGNTVWQMPFSAHTAPDAVAVDAGNHLVFMTPDDRELYALNASNCNVKWHVPLGARGSDPAVAKGVVYVGNGLTNLYAFRESDGKLLWQTGNSAGCSDTPAVANGVVYCRGGTGFLRAFKASNGLPLASLITGASGTGFITTPVIVNGAVYGTAINLFGGPNTVWKLQLAPGS